MITVFMGCTNRLSTLERTIASFQKFETPHEIVLVSNGTTEPEALMMLGYLRDQYPSVKKVYDLPACDSMEDVTDNYNHAIRDQYDNGNAGEWFAVSDCDICFDGTDPGALDAYIELAEVSGTAVGPHLRVHDVPACYPLRSRVLACESRLLYRSDMEWHGRIPFTKCQTDTTFHLFPRTRRFNRLHLNPLRVGPPYDAMHLDWYLDPWHPTRENAIYIPNRLEVGSWGKRWIRDYWLDFQSGPEHAFDQLVKAQCNIDDLCVRCFMLAWCYQYGVGCEANTSYALNYLARAIPADHPHYIPFKQHWLGMIFRNDFSSLGWDAA